MEKCKVSVIIPVYNVSDYIIDCVDSYLSQSLKEVEILCVNDASTDDTLKKLKMYSDERVKIINLQKNKGQSYARNIGLKNACGEYVVFSDSDDMMHPNALSKLYDLAEKEKAAGVVFSAEIVNDMGKRIDPDALKIKKTKEKIYTGEKALIELVKNEEFYYSACLYFYRRKELVSLDLKFHEDVRCGEDILYTVFFMLKTQNIRVSHEIHYIRRVRKNSLSTQRVNQVRVDSLIAVIHYLYRAYIFIESEPLKSAIKKLIVITYKILFPNLETLIYENIYNMDLISENKDVNDLRKCIVNSVKGEIFDLSLSKKAVEKLKEHRKVYIYGAGVYAKKTIKYLGHLEVVVEGVIVSSLEGNSRSVLGHRVAVLDKSMEEKIKKEGSLVFIAVKKADAVKKYLDNRNIRNWESYNFE